MTFDLRECSDPKYSYGKLKCRNSVSRKLLQDKIDEIKHNMKNKGINDWDISSVITQMPKEWEVEYISDDRDGMVYI